MVWSLVWSKLLCITQSVVQVLLLTNWVMHEYRLSKITKTLETDMLLLGRRMGWWKSCDLSPTRSDPELGRWCEVIWRENHCLFASSTRKLHWLCSNTNANVFYREKKNIIIIITKKQTKTNTNFDISLTIFWHLTFATRLVPSKYCKFCLVTWPVLSKYLLIQVFVRKYNSCNLLVLPCYLYHID